MRILTAAPSLALTVFLIAVTSPVSARASASASATEPGTPDLSCSGSVHAEAVDLWEHSLRDYFKKQIQTGLLKTGDTYVLYNTQEELQPFVEMTRRCKERPHIDELIETLAPVFNALQPVPGDSSAKGWVCRGGSTCNHVNKLIGTEVQLNSVQFLGLLGALSTTIVEAIPAAQQTSDEKAFVNHSADAIASQLDRWLSPEYFATVTARAHMTANDAVDGQSKYFFLDRDLWFIDLLSDLSELHVAQVSQSTNEVQHLKSLQSKRPQIAQLINLFLGRVSTSRTANGSVAEIDRGFLRNYGDYQYALYDAKDSPISCATDAVTKTQTKTIRVAKSSRFIDPTMGWDFSHARRLVPALDTLNRNTGNLATVFGYKNSRLDPAALVRAFSNQITDKIWNKDANHPLFSNFWDGTNGWYRVGYENGTGCHSGETPYSLTNSFPTGGYPSWGKINPQIRSLGVRLYQLTHTNDAASTSFVKKYYPSLSGPTNTPGYSERNLWMLTLVSSLVDQ